MAARSASATLRGLLGAIAALSSWLNACNVRFAIVGGVAASLHGTPRVTKDVDVVALTEDDAWLELLERARSWEIVPRIADAIAFAKVTRVLLLVHEPTQIEIDLSFGMLPFEAELVDEAEVHQVRGVSFPVAAAEAIIIMKALAMRPRDVADIESIVRARSVLDLDRVRATVAQLSAALEGEDHLSKLDGILESLGRG